MGPMLLESSSSTTISLATNYLTNQVIFANLDSWHFHPPFKKR